MDLFLGTRNPMVPISTLCRPYWISKWSPFAPSFAIFFGRNAAIDLILVSQYMGGKESSVPISMLCRPYWISKWPPFEIFVCYYLWT
jgi:hypothetical protein